MSGKSWTSAIRRSASKSLARTKRWHARLRVSWLYVFFVVLFASSVILLPILRLSAGDRVVLFVGLLTGAIIWWQGHIIRRQMQLQSTLELNKEWNSEEMLKARSQAWLSDKPNSETIEAVLEFLEKVSTLEKERFISLGLIWDTFGWYLWRYYFYCRDVIMEKRSEWTPGETDTTLYRISKDCTRTCFVWNWSRGTAEGTMERS